MKGYVSESVNRKDCIQDTERLINTDGILSLISSDSFLRIQYWLKGY